MRLKLYNTETREKEEVAPLDGKVIRYYTCGPTVYDFAHIGNFRTYVFEDLLKRTLHYFGYKTLHVMNITDVDDKTLNGALKKGISLNAYTEPYTQAFLEDLEKLGIEPADHYPRATECIPDMLELIQGLLDKKAAYLGEDGSVYYSIKAFAPYGRLSHLHLEELQKGASERASADEYEKENAADFVLWKAYDPERDGAIFWESPFGKGRPGWHIECSAMAMKLLGPSIDIHAGGVDLIFPHHENEIAQSEAFSKKPFVRHWAHCEHLLVDHKKMSKRLGNFYTLRDLLEKGYTGRQVRYMLLQAHYRTQLNFTFQGLDGAAASLQRLFDFIERLQEIDKEREGSIEELVQEAEKSFSEALADDLNISAALAALFDLVRTTNQLCDEQKIGKAQAALILDLFKRWDQVLGLSLFHAEKMAIPAELLEALAKRNRARAEKNWAEADKQRALIHAKGYLIEDTPKGAKLKKL
jgi:cysteinyl-tRNA synthetase